MIKYILKRLFIGFITLFILTTTTFFLMKMIPGSPFSDDKFKDPKIIQMLNERYGLDKPIGEQYIIYLKNLAHGDFGESIIRKERQVSDVIEISAPVTIRLGLVAATFALTTGIVLGLVAAISKRKWINNLVIVIATLGVSVPGFLLALLLMILLGVQLRWLPIIGLKTPLHYIMPSIALSFYPIAFVSRLMRSSMLEVTRQDYMVLAKAKGLSPNKVLIKHGLKNALLPIITYAGPMIAFMITGSFVVESLFSIPGIGAEFVSSITNRDYTMIMGLTIFLGAIIIVANIITDVISALVDPRIKLDE